MSRTITVKLPSNSPNPVEVVVPDGFIDQPSAVIVTGKRAFVRSPQALYNEAPLHLDLTGDAIGADAADFHQTILDLETEKKEMARVISDAHAMLTEARNTIDKLMISATAIPATIEKDAEGLVTRLENWIGARLHLGKATPAAPAKVGK